MSNLQALLDEHAKMTEELEALTAFLAAAEGHSKLAIQSRPDVFLYFEEQNAETRTYILARLEQDRISLGERRQILTNKIDAIEALI